MHGGAKWTLISGGALMALGILLMVIGGASAPDEMNVDPTEDVVYSGTDGSISVTPWNYLSVFAQVDSCDEITMSVDVNGEPYPYFYDFCDSSGYDYGGAYYRADGWLHVADIAPLDDDTFQDGTMALDITSNVEVSVIKDPTGTSIAAAGFGFFGCCLGILVLIVGLVLWAVLDDPAPNMTYAPQGYGQPGMQTVGAVPGTYGAPGMVQAPVQTMPNAAGILPAQAVHPGMGAVVPGAVVGAYAVPVVPQGTTVVQAPTQQPQPMAMNMSAAAAAPVQPSPQPMPNPAPAVPVPVAPPKVGSQPAAEALEGQGTFWNKNDSEEGDANVGAEFMS